MAQNFWTAIFAWTACLLVTMGVSLLTVARPAEQLNGLVYSLTERQRDASAVWHQRPAVLALLVLGGAAILTLIFW